MKTIPVPLLAHYALGTTTLAQCIKITRRDGVVLGYTTHLADLVVSAVTYKASGLVFSSLTSNAGLAVDNAELNVLPDDAGTVTRADLLTGLWDNAQWEIFEVNYASVSDGVHVLKTGRLGEFEPRRGEFVAELRGLTQALQQRVGDVTSTTCRYRLGDARCKKDLTSFTYAGSAVTAATPGNRRIFTASGRAEATGWFNEGEVTFTTGDNAGYRRRVKAFSSSVFELAEALPFEVAVADEFTAIAGCRKRHIDDCKDKFNNILNFGGEPDLPGIDELTRAPEVAV